ncbi:MAG: PhnD/SsuA/transferrin family substrate-binding protein [Pseudomonadota bacterium]
MTQRTDWRAALPMYDWPEIRPSTDRFWGLIRDRLRALGMHPPHDLTRDAPAEALWSAADMMLTQSCGLPYVRSLRGRMTLLGAPDYDIPGCAPGWYCSAIVVRRDDPRATFSEFRGSVAAVNGAGSQSGYAALAHHSAADGLALPFFARCVVTGAHRASILSVAEGDADIAAIDYVSWRLATRHMTQSAQLRVLACTDPTPGLPLLCGLDVDAAQMRHAVADAIAMLSAHDRSALDPTAFCEFDPKDYDIIEKRAERAPRLCQV